MWPDVVRQLDVPDFAAAKLFRRGISEAEACQLRSNRYRLSANPLAGASRSSRPRLFMIGTTDGGRFLTLVVESTYEIGTWLVITGWDSDRDERRLLKHG